MRSERPEGSDAGFVDAVARRVIEVLREEEQLPQDVPRLLTAVQVAKRFGVSTDWVYANANSLGAIRLLRPGHGSASIALRSRTGSPGCPEDVEVRGPTEGSYRAYHG